MFTLALPRLLHCTYTRLNFHVFSLSYSLFYYEQKANVCFLITEQKTVPLKERSSHKSIGLKFTHFLVVAQKAHVKIGQKRLHLSDPVHCQLM